MPLLTPSPDPNPRKPKILLPPGAVDSHFHAFGSPQRYPFHPQSKYVIENSSIHDFEKLQATLGIARAVLVSGGGYGADYRYMADVLSLHPDSLRGVALLAEDVSAAEINRLNSLGVRGARFASQAHGGVMPSFSRRIADLVHESGWHIQFYPHATDFFEWIPRLMELENTIVLDHFAAIPAAGGTNQPAFRKLLDIIDTGRVWVKMSGPMRCTHAEPPYPDVTPLARALVAHAPERLVWGTDWPHVNMIGRTMPNDGDLVDLLADWVPDEKLRTVILVDNPARLYGF